MAADSVRGLPLFERGVLALAFACWPVGAGLLLLEGPWRGVLSATLYQNFGAAVFLGWLAGNVCVQRRRRVSAEVGRRLVWVYLFCPPALLFVARALASEVEIVRAPFVPLYGVVVYAIFFALPLTLGRASS